MVSANRTTSDYAAAAISEVGTIHEEIAAAERQNAAMMAKTSVEQTAMATKTAVEEEEFSLTPKVDYNRVAAGLSVLKRTDSKEGEESIDKPSLDYSKLSQNLSVFNSTSNETDDDDNHLSATERMLKLENASRDGIISRVCLIFEIGFGSDFVKFDLNFGEIC